MARARFVQVEGLGNPCLVVCEDDGELPEELIVDFAKTGHRLAKERQEPVTYRLQPSSASSGA